MSIEKVKELVNGVKPPIDRGDEGIHDWAAGNIDDAYQYGWDDGWAAMAKKIREMLAESEVV